MTDKEVWVGRGWSWENFQEDAMVLTNVHSASLCEGRGCVLHHPSPHHMREWPTLWRADRRMMERTCKHGCGHPDPDDAAYRASIGDDDTTHGCDSCCQEPR